MAKSSSVLTRLSAIPALLLVYGFEKAINLVKGRTVFFDPADFPWIRSLEEGCPRIQTELSRVLSGGAYIPEFKEVSVELASQITAGASWKTFFFYAYGRKEEDNCRRCPETTRLVEQIPGMKTAFFSILAPGTHITPHRGPFKGVLRYHLALQVPKTPLRCGIRVGGETRHWETGRSLVFDDTFDHEAWNDSEEPRVVLFVDFLRDLPAPMAAVNRSLIRLIGASPFIQNIFTNLETLKQPQRESPASAVSS